MSTNFYFNNFQNSQEQLLIESLVVESIRIYGHDVKYVPRTLQLFDKIYGEDTQSSTFTQAIEVEMYIKNVEGFAGEGDFLSKFGVQIRDQITFTISRKTFNEEIDGFIDFGRPREGDLIYLPLNGKLFEIKFVEHESIFYQMGALQTYDLKCELFEYNSEEFATGYDEIDSLFVDSSLDYLRQSFGTEDLKILLMEDGNQFLTEFAGVETVDVGAENTTLQTEATTFLNFSELNPFSENGRF